MCARACVYVCVCISVCVCVCMCVFVRACVYACMSMHVYVCMHVCVLITSGLDGAGRSPVNLLGGIFGSHLLEKGIPVGGFLR